MFSMKSANANLILWVACVACPQMLFSVGESAEPRVLDPRLELTLVAKEPDIVTPVGLTFDHLGRLLVIESHTHFPKEDYQGPESDRIRIVEDSNGDGRADRFRNFFTGSRQTMSIARGPENWIYVATRRRIFRIRDTDGDDRADERQEIAHLETSGNYPHNGLCGLCFDGNGGLYFGIGENLGKDYTLVASDATRHQGGGEGGNIFWCRIDGSDLTRIATGFWNPFGICTDPFGRVFSVDNDPDASPPCRLLHIVDGGDYGYQFRYGRSGKHPLQAWDGELPGTLPMVAGTSEAPSAVIPYRGRLYVSSWGEYRVERFALQSRGASFRAQREVVVQGDDDFRPIDFAVGADGSLYFTDWVDSSYNVHGRGRVWRLGWKRGSPQRQSFPGRTDAEQKAVRWAAKAEISNLSESDPFLRQAAVNGLVDSSRVWQTELAGIHDVQQVLGLLEAARRSKSLPISKRDHMLSEALDSPFPEVRLFSVRWIADQHLVGFRDKLERQLSDHTMSVPLFRATLAAMEWLDTKRAPRNDGPQAGEPVLLSLLGDNTRAGSLRVMALRLLGPRHPRLRGAVLRELANSADPAVQQEAVRTLVLSNHPQRFEWLRTIATDESRAMALRADAVSGLPPVPENLITLQQLAKSPDSEVQQESRRLLEKRSKKPNVVPDAWPDLQDTDSWLELLGTSGSRGAGWRVFFGHSEVRCAACHRWNGHGNEVGPDLTGLARRMDRHRVLDSILQPSREIAPRYVPWMIETTDGKLFLGMSLGVQGRNQVELFLGVDGTQFTIGRDEIAFRHLSDRSIMPDGFHRQLTLKEMRDLLVFLTED